VSVFTTQLRRDTDSLNASFENAREVSAGRLLRLRSGRESVEATVHTIAKARSPVWRTTTAEGAGLGAPRNFLE
jgi:hypothetical protein